MAELFSISESKVCGLPSIEIKGPFNAPQETFSSITKSIIDRGSNDIVIDMRHTSFFSSPGLASLIAAFKHITAADGKMFVLGPTKDMMAVLQLTQLSKVLQIAKTETELKDMITSK